MYIYIYMCMYVCMPYITYVSESRINDMLSWPVLYIFLCYSATSYVKTINICVYIYIYTSIYISIYIYTYIYICI